MKVCKVKPLKNDCYCCVDDQVHDGIKISCDECLSKQPECEIISIYPTFFGKVYALVLVGGEIKKLPIERLYEVKEVQPIISINGGVRNYGY